MHIIELVSKLESIMKDRLLVHVGNFKKPDYLDNLIKELKTLHRIIMNNFCDEDKESTIKSVFCNTHSFFMQALSDKINERGLE
jgi:hypothetical protein